MAIENLANSARVRAALRDLAAVTAARLRLSVPPLGDSTPPSGEAAVLAAMLGTADDEPLAARLISYLPSPRGAWDEVLRHGIVGPALGGLPRSLEAACRVASPLSALLTHPAPGQGASLRVVTQRWCDAAEGRLAICLALAEPTAESAVRRWRAGLLDRWRLGAEDARSFVVDVYEAAMAHHREAHLDAISAARAILTDPDASAENLEDASSLAEWWSPLWAMARSELDRLRARRYLDYAYREGLRLARQAQGLLGR